MNWKKRPAALAKLVGGQLCLDFINTVGGRNPLPPRRRTEPGGVTIRDDQLNEYPDLVAWSWHASLFNEATARKLLSEAAQHTKAAAAVVKRALALREAIYRICLALTEQQKPLADDLALLNQELDEARCHERLVPGTGNFVWQWTEDGAALERMLWPLADSAAEFLTTSDLSRLRECGGDDCGWLFVDTSRNGKRQWCVMEDCGNLAKVRRFRARLQET